MCRNKFTKKLSDNPRKLKRKIKRKHCTSYIFVDYGHRPKLWGLVFQSEKKKEVNEVYGSKRILTLEFN